MKRTYTTIVTISLGLVVFTFLWGMAWAAPPDRPLYATCQVTTTADSGAGSLRECMQNAGNGDTITFDTGVFPPGSPATVALTSDLPTITQGSLTIDGTGAGVILDGSTSGPGSAVFHITSNGNLIKEVQVLNFPAYGILIDGGASNNTIADSVISGNTLWGIFIEGTGTMSNTITGNLIGTNASGTAALGNGASGVGIHSSAQYNIVGGNTPTTRNVISGNDGDGVDINDSDNNIVSGNYIGTDINGTVAIPNGQVGVGICCGASNNTVGGDTAGERNLISGNTRAGIRIFNSGADQNVVRGNYIGTDVNGMAAIPNNTGIDIWGGAQSNTVGGTTPGERNIISGNLDPTWGVGVWISGIGTDNNTVIGNYIGTNVNGTAALGNGVDPFGGAGMSISDGASQNIIGGNTPAERNLISGNYGAGVHFGASASNNTLSGNYIGTDVNGTTALPNAGYGIQVSGAYGGPTNNIIGGSNATPGGACSGECNLISGNASVGLTLEDSGTDDNIVIGNYIGTDVNGTTAIPNGDNGVYIFNSASNNTIGDVATPAKRNLISGNAHHGVLVGGSNTLSNTITRNSIHSNAYLGIDLWDGGNTELPAPILSSVDLNLGNVSGTACALCTIEIFSDDNCEGRVYEGTTTADAVGNWSFSKGSALSGPYATATATDAGGNTSEFGCIYRVFLPVLVKPLPSPVLNDISNSDGDGNYTVSWSTVGGATSYILEEDDNATFISPTVVFTGSGTSKAISGQGIGTYYYRVKAPNGLGGSNWSNIKSVNVTN